ncbi:MAG: MFS transporter [Nitrospinaceae bacterium]|nr:MAG: MFS transporter [Nitrospinaceae bacterium]
MESSPSKGYLNLLRTNRPFRNLWYGQVVSELGDWLNSIAIYSLILMLSGSGMAVATAMMAKLLPIFFVSPIAGVVIDRTSRKGVMILSDVLRFFIVLCFLFVEDKGDLWLVYTLVVLEISMAGFFEPARSAIIPSLIPRPQLVTANALSGSTWSVMLAFGAALGGLVVAFFGIQTAFIVDAFTFLISAWFISRIPEKPETAEKKAENRGEGGYKNFVEGMRYLRSKPIVFASALLKSGLAFSGGVMTLIPLYANKLLTNPSAVSLWIGIMYFSRGVGAAIGPVIVRSMFGDSSKVLRMAITIGFFMGAACYYSLARSDSLVGASISIGLSTLFGAIVWVYSSSLIHMEAEERFLGRIFSTEMGLLTLVMGISNWAVGYSVDHLQLTLETVVLWMAFLFLIPGVSWWVFLLFARQGLKEGKCETSICPVDPSGFNPVPPPVRREGNLPKMPVPGSDS